MFEWVPKEPRYSAVTIALTMLIILRIKQKHICKEGIICCYVE